MKSGTHTLHWKSPMPGRTQRAHESPRTSDSLGAIRRASNDRLGADHIRAIDCNLQLAGSHAWGLHWTRPAMNGYKWVIDPRTHRCRAMTWRERRTPASRWGNRVGDWRRGRHSASERPHTYPELLRAGVKYHVVVVGELKSENFRLERWGVYLVNAAKAADHPMWVMALLKMRSTRGKCESVEGAGGQFALIFGKWRRMAKPRDWAQWRHHPTQIWGPVSAKRWLRG